MTKKPEPIQITPDILIEYIEELATDNEIMLEEDPDEEMYLMNEVCIDEIRKAVCYRIPMECKVNSICPECGALFSIDIMNLPGHYCPKCGQHVTKKTKP